MSEARALTAVVNAWRKESKIDKSNSKPIDKCKLTSTTDGPKARPASSFSALIASLGVAYSKNTFLTKISVPAPVIPVSFGLWKAWNSLRSSR